MKNLFLVVIAIAVGASVYGFGADGESTTGMELLPQGRPFRLTFADPREIRMAIGFEGDSRINAAIGNYFSLFAIRPLSNDWKFHFGLEGAGFFTMRSSGGRFPLETADGLIGLYTEMADGPWQFQLRYTHVSAHFADGTTAPAIAYSRETLMGRAAYVPNDTFQAYAGTGYLVNTTPKLPGWILQVGGSFFVPWGTTKLVPFVATDLKWREESDTRLSVSAQLGLALNNPPQAYRSFRFFYAYFSGANPRGQFFNQSYTSHSVGIEMQI